MIICSTLLIMAFIVEVRSFPLTINNRTPMQSCRYHQQPFISNAHSIRRPRLLTSNSNGDEMISDRNYDDDSNALSKSDNSTSSKGDSLRSTIVVAIRDIRRQLRVKIRLQCNNLIRNIDSAMLDKALTSAVGFFIADFMAQSLQFKVTIKYFAYLFAPLYHCMIIDVIIMINISFCRCIYRAC